MANIKCKQCGCTCKNCVASDHDVQLHVEIENLKQRLLEKENHIVTMETNFLNEANKFPNGEVVALREELLTWQDKYSRLYDAHRRVQRVNQGLEDKLLKLVDVCETDKNTLTKDVATLSQKLAEAHYTIKKLTDDNERYKKDVSLAIHFLQCKQSNFVAHKFDTLPPEIQSQVSSYMSFKRKPEEKRTPPEIRSIKVPIPTFPPTAMVYSVPKSPRPDRRLIEEEEKPAVDIVSAAIMAKVLQERQRERASAKHCDTCTCSRQLKIIYNHSQHSIGTQTGEYREMLCIKCNDAAQLSSGVKVVRNPEAKPLETMESNVVKVQPNNFLINNESNNSSLIDLSSNLTNSSNLSPKNFSNTVIHERNQPLHHYLCKESSPAFEKSDYENNIDKSSAKNTSSDRLKGPRFCSMRLQSGSRNILLDNAQNNIAPVLYTHKMRNDARLSHDLNSSSNRSEDKTSNSFVSENSTQNRQRVAEWIQNNNVDTDEENSRCEYSDKSQLDRVDKVKYAEMEENVKRFLFGESEFMKTVEIGKLKYQNYRETETSASCDTSKKNSLTETEI